MRVLTVFLLGWSLCALRAADWSFDLPPTNYYAEEVNADWRGVDGLGLTLQLIGEASETPLLLSLFIQTEEGHWLESREDLVLTGGIQRFELSLREGSVDWRMSNGDRLYGQDLLRRVKSWGLRLYCAQPHSGVIRVGRLEKRGGEVMTRPEFVLRDLPEELSVGEMAMLGVEPRNWRGDLFDASQCPRFEIRMNGGSRMLDSVWVQEYRDRRTPGQTALRSVPWMRPVFRTHWRPPEEGEAEVRLHLPGEEGAGQLLGRIRVSPAKKAEKIPERPGTPSGFFRSLPEAGQNWRYDADRKEWVAADLQGYWTPRLDWTAEWGTYDGLGEFMQPRAAAFEQQLPGSGHSGPLRVVTENVLNDRTTFNWQDHPWNLKNGGRHLEPTFVWSDPEWVELAVRRAVYLWNRYGSYDQCNGLYIEVTRGATYYADWVNALTARLSEELPGVPVYCPSPGLPTRQVTSLLQTGTHGWRKPDQLFGAEQFIEAEPAGAMILVGASEAGFDATVPMMQHWSDREVLRLDLEAQFSDGVFPSMQLHVRTDPDRVFTSELIPLHNRELNRVFLDLEDAEAWSCFQEPGRKWTPLERMNIREVILRVYTDKPDPSASFKIHQLATVTQPLSVKRALAPLAIRNLNSPGAELKTLQKAEWIFDLNRFFQNPYNPEEIAVDLKVTLPDGREVTHPGFFNQHVKRVFAKGVERWDLQETYDWRVRFRPWMDGEHTWTLEVVYTPPSGGERVRLSEKGQFKAEGRGDARGFVLQSEKDPRFLEFQNGEFFYPLGHTMRNPTDRRPGIYDQPLMKTLDAAEDKGTEIYAEWFKKMQENGGNFARVWISNWWLGIEWNSRHSGYHGRKYFNQQNAARLDRLIELAETYGMYLNLETTNHGTFSSSTDAEWDENPWSAFSPDEGPIRYASEFVTSEEGKKWHEYKMRYLIARAGHSPAVAFWGVLTETEWTEAYYRYMRDLNSRQLKPYHPRPYRNNGFREPLKQWTNQTAAFLKNHNAHPALATTHFSNPGNGMDFWRLPELSVVYNNAYSGFFNRVRPSYPRVNRKQVKHNYPYLDRRRDPFYAGIVREVFGYADFFREVAEDDRVVIIGEWGGRPSNNRDDHLIAEFHSGTWTSLVTELSGVGGFWWYNLVDYHDLFPLYRAVSNFMEGEDLRGKTFQQARWAVYFPNAGGGREDFRMAVGKSTKREAMGYIFSKALSHSNRSRPPSSFADQNFPESGAGWLAVPDTLENGQYRVEFWNTFTGEVIQEKSVVLHPEGREIAVPSHRVDLALKLKYEKKLPPPTPTPAPTPTPVPPPTPTPVPPAPTPVPQILNPDAPPTLS